MTVSFSGGTFNTNAPSWPFLASTWQAYMAALGAPVCLTMPEAGFYPRGGGRLVAEVTPAALRPLTLVDRGPLVRITGAAGVARLGMSIAARMRDRATQRLAAAGIAATVAIDLVQWNAPSPGAAIHLSAEHGVPGQGVAPPPATFVGLGERGKLAEAVADEAVDELLAFESAGGAVDPHSADQILIPLALAAGPSAYTVPAVTEHLRTNARTIRAFLDRTITIDGDGTGTGQPGRVIVG